MAESALPPVTFGVKVTHETLGHVYVTVFAGRTPGARGCAGQLVFRHEEFEAFLRLLSVTDIDDAEHQDTEAACLCDLIDVRVAGGPPEYVRGRSNGCLRHQVPGEISDAEARRKAREA